MKILIINQPLNNRGDESAHKALVRTLLKRIPNVEITVLFEYDANKDSIKQYAILNDRIQYICHNPFISKGFRKLSQFGLKKNLHFLWNLHPGIRSWMNFYKNTDYVICAPGGINMGGFQSWYHLFNLYCAKIYKKPVAYYGRSIGPFPENTPDEIRFKQISKELLHYFEYISIRDKQSEQEMKQFNIPFVPVIDTAFLETPKSIIPVEIDEKLVNTPFFVFVPNILIWHYAFKGKASQETVADFYIEILKKAFDIYPQYKVVMLPQTFNSKSPIGNDVNFFRFIAQRINDSRIIIASDNMSSDIQQTIISKSQFVIGARYHSVVFAINNSVPVIALNYEHKIAGLLENLNLIDVLVDIRNAFDSIEESSKVIKQIEKLLSHPLFIDPYISLKAKTLAREGFVSFENSFMKHYDSTNY